MKLIDTKLKGNKELYTFEIEVSKKEVVEYALDELESKKQKLQNIITALQGDLDEKTKEFNKISSLIALANGQSE